MSKLFIMKIAIVFIQFVLISFLGNSQSTLIQNTNVINVHDGAISRNQNILIENGRISVISDKKLTNPVDMTIDGKDKYVMPGLWDMHAHLSIVGEASIPLFVINGVTGVRDMGGNWEKLKHWRQKGNDLTQFLYPTIRTAGPIIESPRFYGLLDQLLGNQFTKDRISVASVEDAHIVVDSLVKLGVDLVKVRTVASEEVFKALSQKSKEVGIPFTGHIDHPMRLKDAISSGISTIEHDIFLQFLSMNRDDVESTLKSIEEFQPGFTPTIIATEKTRSKDKYDINALIKDSTFLLESRLKYLSPQLIENWQIQAKLQQFENPMNWDSIIPILRSHSKKIGETTTLLAGTDVGVLGVFPGSSLHEELALMVRKFGYSNLLAIQSATINPARTLNLTKRYGSVEQGKIADLLMLNSNPLEDIANTSDIYLIFKNGNPIAQQTILSRKEAVARNVNLAKEDYSQEMLNQLNSILEKQ